MNSEVCLYTVCHKPFFIPTHQYLQPVWVGSNKNVRPVNAQADDSGDNISHSNEFFCELTVLYWVWKNKKMEEKDSWGLCHYRRFFTDKERPFSFSKFPLNRDASEKNILHYVHASLDDSIRKKLQHADVILTYPVNVSLKRKVVISVYDQYLQKHSKEEWEILQTVINEKYPDYTSSFLSLSHQTKMCIGNMMIARSSVWNSYLPWLFDILFEVHKRISYSNDTYQRRATGFMAERLMNLYVQHNQLKISYMQLVIFDK